MRLSFYISLIAILFSNFSFCQNSPSAIKAWKVLNEGNVKEATKLFMEDDKNPESLVSLMMLGNLDRKGKSKAQYIDKYLKEGVYENAVLYALRNGESTFGEQGSKEKYHVNAIQKALDLKSLNPSLRASLEYDVSVYEMYTMDLKEMEKTKRKVEGLRNWAVIGPFEDLMNSGYDSNTGVLEALKPSDIVTNEVGAKLSWYTPTLVNTDPWIIKQAYYSDTRKILYFQSFIKIDEAGQYDLGLGYSGNVKMWVDDQEVHNYSETIISDFDIFNYQINLEAGYHRILIQIGSYTANFPYLALRVFDKNGVAMNLDGVAEYQPYSKSMITAEAQEHFAEKHFNTKVKSSPFSLLDKLLLAKTYMNAYKLLEAEKQLKEAEEIAPNNPFVLFYLLDLYRMNNNSSEQSKYTEKYLKQYPENVNVKLEDFSETIQDKDYQKAYKLLEEIKSIEADEHDDILLEQSILILEGKYTDLMETVEKGYDKFPNSDQFANMKSILTDEVSGDKKGSIDILEKYLKNNFSYDQMKKVIRYYFDTNQAKKAISKLEELHSLMGYDKSPLQDIMNYHFRQKDYSKALEIIDDIEANRKYESSLYVDRGDIYFNWNKQDEAIAHYNKALTFAPYNYTLKNKIYNLKNDKNISELADLYEIEDLIQEFNESPDSKDVSYDYNILFHEKSYILLNGGAKSLTEHYALKLNNQASLENWQRVDFGYNGSLQRLTIEEANVYKTDGSELKGEKYGSEVVFTNLEIGDIIYAKYKIESSESGRSAKFFSDNFTFNGYSPCFKSRYQLLVEDGVEYTHKIVNGEVSHSSDKRDNFTHHKWQIEGEIPIFKNEGSTPSMLDLATTIHIASSYEWSDIAAWYSDLSSSQSKMEYSLEKLLDDIFPKGHSTYSDNEKARKIYDYIVTNIQYSSISFRQSSFTPQRASDVYHTRIGDCKDVSTLYSTLAREVGLNSELVLISTSDNGKKNLSLPSINFNHCIVSVLLDDKRQFLELTDPYQSFGSLSYLHHGAPIVLIPIDASDKRTLQYLDPSNRTVDAISHNKIIKVDGKDIHIQDQVTYSGNPATNTRASFRDINEKDRKSNVESSIIGRFDNGINLKSFSFEQLDELNDNVIFNTEYIAKKEVIKIGKLNTFKVPFSDIIFSSNSFLEDERISDFDLNPYENTDVYAEEISIELNSNETLEELPENVTIDKLGIKYELTFKAENVNTLKIVRTVQTNRTLIPQADYGLLKSIAEEIIEAENTHIVFKRSK